MMSSERDPVKTWCEYLRSHGWKPYQRKPGFESLRMWVSPTGGIYRGPYGAFLAAKAIEEKEGPAA